MTQALLWSAVVSAAVSLIISRVLIRRKVEESVLATSVGADVVIAKKFLLLDSDGKVRGNLIVAEHGPVLELSEATGKVRVALGMPQRAGAGLNVYNREGDTRATLTIGDVGVSLYLYDANRQPRVRLELADIPAEGSWSAISMLTLCYRNGRPSVAISLLEDVPTLIIYAEDGSARLSTIGGNQLILQDKDGKVIWEAP